MDMTTSRTATAAEIAAFSRGTRPHQVVATVETNEDARATVGKANTVHRAMVTRYLNSYGEPVGTSAAAVTCGAKHYRGRPQTTTACSSKYAVDCERCLAEG